MSPHPHPRARSLGCRPLERVVSGHLWWRSVPVSTARRWCPKCEKEYVATVYSERQAGEISLATVSSCPDCDTDGQLPADVPPNVRDR
jgi:hypothetical protein